MTRRRNNLTWIVGCLIVGIGVSAAPWSTIPTWAANSTIDDVYNVTSDVKQVVTNVTYGNSGVRSRLDSVATNLSNMIATLQTYVGTKVDPIANKLNHSTYGVEAIKNAVTAVDSRLQNGSYGLSAISSAISSVKSAVDSGNADSASAASSGRWINAMLYCRDYDYAGVPKPADSNCAARRGDVGAAASAALAAQSAAVQARDAVSSLMIDVGLIKQDTGGTGDWLEQILDATKAGNLLLETLKEAVVNALNPIKVGIDLLKPAIDLVKGSVDLVKSATDNVRIAVEGASNILHSVKDAITSGAEGIKDLLRVANHAIEIGLAGVVNKLEELIGVNQTGFEGIQPGGSSGGGWQPQAGSCGGMSVQANNPVDWIKVGTTCALVGNDQNINGLISQAKGAIGAPVQPWTNAAGGVAAAWEAESQGCQGPKMTMPLPGIEPVVMYPLSACSEPMKTVASITRLIATIMLLTWATWTSFRAITAGLGYSAN
ncbi:MAG: hypothetical protein QM658_16810 [Gordonia sp. (in: high G+C Gram-positive bacteria)]